MAYTTVARQAEVETVIKKSRFIAHVAQVKSEDGAWSFIQQIRARHPEATHNCFAFKAGEAVRMSDDGEPSGTAGRPIYDVVDKQGLSDTVIVVTRYFGGILLGAGGLVRAYSQAAVAGVEAAGTVRGATAVDLVLTLNYTLVGKVQHLIQQQSALPLDSQYGSEVTISCRVLQEHVKSFISGLAEASAGRILVRRLQELQVGADLKPL